ncbi:MAG: hypothetical protein KA362_12025 [Chloroflexi bacterium]|nr:hypothetical protein [Chloroflexota bacterium]MBK6709466.1 hypothetical protein [Chloroflexota bacterium]MBK7178600.1 hypothetical protein [Chloroflexota bacterium]MBK7915237.1 hypothetical protein [Chloroflexota bacterium]MBK8935576.1 hypothetical protein [Chloroflexota bacterium]
MKLPDDWQIRVIQLLSVFGMFVAYFLLLFHNGDIVGVCEPGGFEDCGIVSGPGAPYSAIGPIPVALIGLLGYITIFMVAWLKDWVGILDDYLPEIMIGLTGLAVVFTLYLTLLEIFIIHAVCRYCLISAGIIIIQLILAIGYIRAVNKAVD